MTQALAYGFPPSSDNGNETSQSFGLEANFNVSQDSRPPGTLSVNMLNAADRQPPASEPNGETGMGQNGGLHGHLMYHQDNSAISRPGNTEYDNFLAITGLGVKMPSQGSETASRLGLGSELDRLKGQPQQGIPASLQEYLNGMTRPPSSIQIPNLHSRQPPPTSINMLHSDLPPPPGISQEHQQTPGGALGISHMLANGFQHAQPENAAAPPESGTKPTEEKSEQAPPAPATDIQQLLFNISMPQMNGVSRSSSRNSILNLNGMPAAGAGGNLADVLAAVQPQPTALPKADAQDGEPAAAQAAQPAGAPETPAAAEGDSPQASLQPRISAFAAVADSPLDEDASKAPPPAASEAPAQHDAIPASPFQALPPPQVKPGALAGPQLAQNLFDPPFPTVASSSSFTAEGPAARPASTQEGLLSRIPNPEHAALLQQLQQYAPDASPEDLLRALHTHILQQAQLQQRNSAPAAQNGSVAASGGLNAGLGAALPNHASYPGAGNADLLRQGMLTRGGLPQQQQQLNRQLYPGQVSGQMNAQMGGQMAGQLGGQLGGRATPPVGLQPPFQGLAERALAGMEPFNNAQPKPQATTQQMRFGGNIGVHAINRTSAAPLNNPTQQLMQPPGGVLGGQGMGPMGTMGNLGGLGGLSAMNNPLAGLPGAPRPAIRPPNWQRTQALAQQAAQAQAQQQAAIKMAAARAEAQRQAQLQAAQQQNRNNFLAGLTPAQVQLLMNAPAHQVNALAAQLGILDTSARPGNLPTNLGAPAPNLAANQALLQQQKLAAARASYANQQVQAQRTAANPMLGLQQPPQQPLMGLQQARQGVRNIPGPVNKFGPLGVGNPTLNVAPQPAQVGAPAAALPPRTNVLEMGRYLAQNGISVEQAVNSGILGGFSAFDVRALSEGHHQELQRLRNVRSQQAAQAAMVSQQQQQQQVQQQVQQQQLLQQQLLRQNQLQQLQQAQAAQAAQQQAHAIPGLPQNGSDAGSQVATPSATAVMNLGPGSLGQLFDWGAGQAQQQALSGSAPQGGDWDPNSMRNLLGTPMGTALHPQLSGSANALTGLPGAPLARNPSDAGSELNLSLHNLRSKSPWEGGHGGQMAATQQQSAHSSRATTPRSARPGTMGSLLEVPGSGFGAIGLPAAAPKYPSQGSLDGEFTGYVKPTPGAHAPIGRGSKTSQAEVPSSVRAFWETGASHPGPLSTSISLDSNRAAGYAYNPTGNIMEPALDLEALDAALEAQSNLATGMQAEQRTAPESVRIPVSAGQQAAAAPGQGDLNSFDSGNYSFFNQASLAETAQELRGLSLESEIEDRAGIGNLLDDIGPSDAPTQAPRH